MKVCKERISFLTNLAESIANKYIVGSCVDPFEIANQNRIAIHRDDFGETFEGSICCNMKSKKFHIFLNIGWYPNYSASCTLT